jgi:hypothetical protein
VTHSPENSSAKPPSVPDATLDAWRQVYELAKAGAPNARFGEIPDELLTQFQAEEQPPISESGPEKQRNLEDVLADGRWHPVMAAGAETIRRGEPLSLWVSEVPEDPLGKKADHSGASAFLVDRFVPMTWFEKRDDLSTHGRAINFDRGKKLHLVSLAEDTYIRMDAPQPKSPPQNEAKP